MDQVSLLALAIGMGLLLLSLFLWLLRITRGVPAWKRMRLMAWLVGTGLWEAVPSWRTASPLLGGGLAALLSFFLGIGITILVIRSIPLEVPNPTEAYEGVGDYLMTMFRFTLGCFVSLSVSMFVGFVVAVGIAA